VTKKNKRGRPKAVNQVLKDRRHKPCRYCHVFNVYPVVTYCLSCGRAVGPYQGEEVI